MAASRQVLFHAKFGSAPNSRPNASLADGSVCRVTGGGVGENKELGVLVNGMFFNETDGGFKLAYSAFQNNRRLSRMFFVTNNIATYRFI